MLQFQMMTQQKNIEYDLRIVCINSSEGFGNIFFYQQDKRENVEELNNYDIVFNGFKKNKKLKQKLKN